MYSPDVRFGPQISGSKGSEVIAISLCALWSVGGMLWSGLLWQQTRVDAPNRQYSQAVAGHAAVYIGASVLLMLCGVVATLLWIGGRRAFVDRPRGLTAACLGTGLCVNFWVIVMGPFRDIGWWGDSVQSVTMQVRLDSGLGLVAWSAAAIASLRICAKIRSLHALRD